VINILICWSQWQRCVKPGGWLLELWILGTNPSLGMNVCFFMFCCFVKADRPYEGLPRLSVKYSYQMFKRSRISVFILNWNRIRDLVCRIHRQTWRRISLFSVNSSAKIMCRSESGIASVLLIARRPKGMFLLVNLKVKWKTKYVMRHGK
jgi:hypothetical protein